MRFFFLSLFFSFSAVPVIVSSRKDLEKAICRLTCYSNVSGNFYFVMHLGEEQTVSTCDMCILQNIHLAGWKVTGPGPSFCLDMALYIIGHS